MTTSAPPYAGLVVFYQGSETPTSVRATWRCESYGPTTGTVQ